MKKKSCLTLEDQKNFDAFDHLLRLIKARVNGVAKRKHVGVYISGRAGTGKTVTVEETLRDQKANYQYINCRVSPGGLYEAMKANPEDVFVLDDVSTLYKHPQGLQVLLAALNGRPDEPRPITYVLKGEQKEPTFQFLGGIVAISNRPLHRDPIADAVASRVRPLEHEPSDEMIAAIMRSQALKGFEDMSPEQCSEVVEYVIEQSRRCEYRLDLRHMEHGWQDYRLWKDGESFTIHWNELIASSMSRILQEDEDIPVLTVNKAHEINVQRETVRLAVETFPGSRQRQIEFARLAKRTFDRRLGELKRLGLLPNCHIASLPAGKVARS
jgi:hypothetical protein